MLNSCFDFCPSSLRLQPFLKMNVLCILNNLCKVIELKMLKEGTKSRLSKSQFYNHIQRIHDNDSLKSTYNV